jgi:hypothetical protein
MNKLILMMLSLMSVAVFAVDCDTSRSEEKAEETLEIKTDVPDYLKGATITVKQADGKETVFTAEQFKVVPRKQQFIVTKTRQLEKTTCSEEERKNRFSLLGGGGPKGNLRVTQPNAGQARIETNAGAVGGAMYQRKLGKVLSVGGQVQTNESVLFSVGVDF